MRRNEATDDPSCQWLDLPLRIETERDGDRWIADVVDLPGVLVYGATRAEALCAAQALALEVLADRIKHGEDLRTGHRSNSPRSAVGSVSFIAA